MFEVILSPSARDVFEEADQSLERKLLRCFQHLEVSPRIGNNIKRLSGKLAGYSRYRIGDWRVVYRIDDARGQVNVLIIAHRREVYE